MLSEDCGEFLAEENRSILRERNGEANLMICLHVQIALTSVDRMNSELIVTHANCYRNFSKHDGAEIALL